MTSFGPVAPYYDELMKSVPYRMWVGYYLLLLAQQEVSPKRLLDVCCGTGTMCEMLTREGFDVEGFDLSGPMIEEARRKAKRKGLDIRYEVADAAEVDMGTRYDAALSFFDSLNNILDPSRLQLAFQRVGAHLRPGGSFIFDLNTAYAFEQRMFDQENLRANAKLRYQWQGEYDPNTSIIEVNMKFWYRGEEFSELHVQRAHDPEDVVSMLEDAGFQRIRIYHAYTLSPRRKNSDRLHFACIRA